MKVNYRGFEVEAHRDKSMAGIELIFYSVYSIKDGIEFDAGFSYSDETIREFIKGLKSMIDDFYKDPEEYRVYEELTDDEKAQVKKGIEL